MNEEALNMSVRKFLKQVGVTSQREIETTVREAIEAGRLSGSESVPVKMTLEVPELNLRHEVEGTIRLE